MVIPEVVNRVIGVGVVNVGSFQVSYHYKANEQGTPDKIIDVVMNGIGVPDTRRALGVIAHLKKIKAREG